MTYDENKKNLVSVLSPADYPFNAKMIGVAPCAKTGDNAGHTELSDNTPSPEQMAAINAQIEVLGLFNRKVDKLEQGGFCKRYETEVPNVIAKFADVKFEKTGHASFAIMGRIHSWVEDFNQDEIDAFVLTYRIFTQNNDQLSLASLSRIYGSDWLIGNAKECFDDARKELNDYLDRVATIMFGEHQISIRQLVDIIIYGGLAHSNPEKADIFQNWEQSGAIGFIWAEFFAYARHAVETLKYLRSLNAGVLEHSEKYGFTLGEASPP
jgi:hypothetical protein